MTAFQSLTHSPASPHDADGLDIKHPSSSGKTFSFFYLFFFASDRRTFKSCSLFHRNSWCGCCCSFRQSLVRTCRSLGPAKCKSCAFYRMKLNWVSYVRIFPSLPTQLTAEQFIESLQSLKIVIDNELQAGQMFAETKASLQPLICLTSCRNSALAKFRNIDWRIEMEVHRKNLRNVYAPVVLMRISTSTGTDQGPDSGFVRMRISDVHHMRQVMEEALREANSHKIERQVRKWIWNAKKKEIFYSWWNKLQSIKLLKEIIFGQSCFLSAFQSVPWLQSKYEELE